MSTYRFDPFNATGLLGRLWIVCRQTYRQVFRRFRNFPQIPANFRNSPQLTLPHFPTPTIPWIPSESEAKTTDSYETKQEPAADPTESEKPTPISQNRQQRRQAAAWERQRRKQDKWVEPRGPTPVKLARGARAERSETRSETQSEVSVPVGETLVEDEQLHYRESEIWGQFSFRDTILDQLERYWIYLERMKKHDRDAYEFYKRMGATVMPPISWFLHQGVAHKREIFKDLEKEWKLQPLSPWWKEHRPAFGCVTFGITKQIETEELTHRDPDHPTLRLWVPKFLYFTKYKTPPANVQPTTNGDVYGMTIWWDRPHEPDAKNLKKHPGGIPEQYAVYISADGSDVHVLPQCETEYVPIRRKKSNNGYKRGHTFTIPHRTWHIPGHYSRWAKRLGTTPNMLLSCIFMDAANAVEQAAYSMVRVAVHNRDLTAVFGVDIKRMAYFFQDRDITLTERGARRRAFHIVRAHERRDGSAVKLHFRGEKDFTWAGYEVNITIPGRDHFMLQEFEMGMDDMGTVRKKDLKHYVGNKEVAEKLLAGMERGAGGVRPQR